MNLWGREAIEQDGDVTDWVDLELGNKGVHARSVAYIPAHPTHRTSQLGMYKELTSNALMCTSKSGLGQRNYLGRKDAQCRVGAIAYAQCGKILLNDVRRLRVDRFFFAVFRTSPSLAPFSKDAFRI